MKQSLDTLSCEPCRIGGETVTETQAGEWLADLPHWRQLTDEGVNKLAGEFRFPDWEAAMRYANRISELAGEQDHHPAMTVEWGKVTLRWWTHKIGGLHRNDFIMAAKSSEIARELNPAGS